MEVQVDHVQELYIISNTDTRSFRHLDLWLEQIDTDKIHRNFEHDEEEVVEAPVLADFAWEEETDAVVKVARDRQFSDLSKISAKELTRCLEVAWQCGSRDLVDNLYQNMTEQLRAATSVSGFESTVLVLVSFLEFMFDLVVYFIRLQPWSQLHLSIHEQLVESVPQLVVALVACANKIGRIAASSITAALYECKELQIDDLKSIIEMAALTIASPETALDVLLEGLEPTTSRLVLLTPRNSQYLTAQLSAIAIDHIEEAVDSAKSSRTTYYQWKFDYTLVPHHGNLYLKCDYRIDAPKSVRLAVGDHVKLVCVNAPPHVIGAAPAYFEALVEKSDAGQVTFKCLRRPPGYYRYTLWRLEHLGSFVTAQTMMDAVTKLLTEKQTCCEIFSSLFPSQHETHAEEPNVHPASDLTTLNASQRSAVVESLSGPVTCVWGPPGTGKTHTIVSIINEILLSHKEKRLLVTAPTHNAVDNVMRKYLDYAKRDGKFARVESLRVSTDVSRICNHDHVY